jgi:alkanesulfonate monooxygenase SsuD/methylene tetrahydromethanopterin reductase-like flavin-dependent oxidoreductase (luciferase family)
MRFSLFVPPQRVPGQLRTPGYRDLENQVVAAEIHGLSALWLAEATNVAAPQRPTTLRMLDHLSAITDRIDLGLLLRLPPAPLRSRLAEQIGALDDRSEGRTRLALACQPEDDLDAALALLAHAGALIGADRAPRPAERLQLRADATSAARAVAHGYGLVLPDAPHAEVERGWLAHATERPRWVVRTLTVVVAASALGVAELSRCIAAAPVRQSGARRLVIGTPEQVLTTLASAQVSAGIDELACDVAPPGVRPEQALKSIELLGGTILPRLRALTRPRPTALPQIAARERARGA